MIKDLAQNSMEWQNKFQVADSKLIGTKLWWWLSSKSANGVSEKESAEIRKINSVDKPIYGFQLTNLFDDQGKNKYSWLYIAHTLKNSIHVEYFANASFN